MIDLHLGEGGMGGSGIHPPHFWGCPPSFWGCPLDFGGPPLIRGGSPQFGAHLVFLVQGREGEGQDVSWGKMGRGGLFGGNPPSVLILGGVTTPKIKLLGGHFTGGEDCGGFSPRMRRVMPLKTAPT